jgi:hypothetical protein
METFSAYASLAGDAGGMIPGGKALGLAAKEGFEGAADGANIVSKTWSGVKGGFSGIGRSALDDANDAWRVAGESTKGSVLLMADIHVNGINVAANAVSSAESFGAVGKDGAEHNAAEGTKAAATAHGIAGLLGLL